MTKLSVAYAGHRSDRVEDLYVGTVTPEGIDLHFLPFSPSEAFQRMMRGQFPVGEMSFSTYIASVAAGDSDFVAIPIFPSRTFRHSAVYVAEEGPIERPEDLAGRRVGVPEYQMTAALWVRGMLEDEYGLSPSSMEWVTGGLRDPGRRPLIEVDVAGVNIRREVDRSLDDLLVSGELDAIIAPQAPPSFESGAGVRRLFRDYRRAEAEYYAKTQIFPIMHTVVLRREFYESYPWAAVSLFDAFEEARMRAFERLFRTEPLPVSLPWFQPELEHTVATMGRDFWPYGIEQNRRVIEAACEYVWQQGLCPRRVSLEELFAPSVAEGASAKLL